MKPPTVLHVEDEARIENLRKRMGVATALEVIRRGLDRLEKDFAHEGGEAFGTTSEEVLFDMHETPDAGGA